MRLNGQLLRDGKFWAVQCPALGALTQGLTRKEALEMIVDWVQGMLDEPAFDVGVEMTGKDSFHLVFASAAAQARILAFIVARRREEAGLTMRELADRLGLAHKSTIAQAETGRNELGLSRLGDFLAALDCDVVLDVVPRASRPQARPARPARGA